MISKIKEIYSNPVVKKYTSNTSWLFFEKIFRMVTSLFVGIWVAKFLGPKSFGIYSYAQSFVSLFAALSTLGLDSIVVRDLVKCSDSEDKILGTAFILKMLASLIIFCMIVVILYFTEKDRFILICILIISLTIIFQSFNVLDFYFQSKVQSKFVVYSSLFSFVISSITKIILIVFNAQLLFFVLTATFEIFIFFVMLIFLYKKMVANAFNWSFDFIVAKRLLKDSWPLIPHKFSFVIIANIDQIMLAKILDIYSVGIYSLAYKIVMLFYSMSTVLTKSLFPALVNFGEEQKRRFVILYRMIFYGALSIIFLYYFFIGDFVIIIFGEKFLESKRVLDVLIFSILFSFLTAATGKWYIVNNYTKLFLIRTLIGALINVVLNIFLINKYGCSGAAISTIITFLFICYFSNLMHKSTFENLKLVNKAIFFLK